ncbi:transposase [Micromonospora sp. NBC_01739]|nr:transposase [Micromonospora sp. NBC_01739]
MGRHATDTRGATLANFALFDLVGKQLSPRIRDLGDSPCTARAARPTWRTAPCWSDRC